jgi:hypothetical protein
VFKLVVLKILLHSFPSVLQGDDAFRARQGKGNGGENLVTSGSGGLVFAA